jgi:cyclase family protein
MKIIDLSYTLDESCMTCGTPWHEKVKLVPLGTIETVGRNTHSITLGSHTGTHMDAPLHFLAGADSIDKVNLEKLCGSCKVVDMSYKGKGDIVTLEDVRPIEITTRMLFRFCWFRHWKTDMFYKGFPFFSEDAAKYLVDCGLKVLALDTPSPDDGNAIGKMDDSPVHKILLKHDVTIIEYLTNTDRLDPNKSYDLFALPLKLRGCDGAPSRVIMVEE